MRRNLNPKFVIGLMVTFALLGGGVHLMHGRQEKRNLEALLEMADRAERKQDEARARRYLERYLTFRPSDGDALARLGLMLADGAPTAQMHRQALQILERALVYAPDRDDARRRAAELAMAPEIGRPKDAKEYLVTLLLKPSNGRLAASEDRRRLESLLLEFAHQGVEQGPPPSLVKLLARPDADLEDLLGRCLEDQGRTGLRSEAESNYRKASACYRLAIRRSPARVDIYVRLAALLRDPLGVPAQADRVMDAGEIHDGVVATNPDSYRAYLARAHYRKSSGLPGSPEDVARAQRLAPEEADVLVAAGGVARDQGQLAVARTLLERGVERHPRDLRMYQGLAAIETQAGRFERALDVLRRGDKALPDRTNLQWNLASLLIDTGKPGAKAVIDRLRTQAAVFQPAVDYLEARLLLNTGQRAEGVRRLEKARALMANVPDLKDLTAQADLLLAQSYEQLGNPEQQLAASRRVLALEPDSVPARLTQASALSSLGRPNDSLEVFRKVASGSAVARLAVARLLLAENLRLSEAQRRWPEFDQALDEAARGAADPTEVAILRADGLAARGQLEQARERLEQVRKAETMRVEPWIALAGLAGRQGKPEASLSILDDARDQLGDRVELRLARAYYWAQRRGPDAHSALDQLAQNLDTISDDDRNRLEDGLADAFAQIGDLRRAEQIWTGVAERRPDDLRTAIRLFDLALQTGGPTAPETLSRAVERLRLIEGEDGAHWRFGEATRLVRLARDGDPRQLDQARMLLAEAAKRRPEWSQVPRLEAAIAEQEGNPVRATDAYIRAIERGERQPQLIRRTVTLLYAQRRVEEADRLIQKLIDQGPPTGIVGQLAAERALRNQDRTQTLELAGRAVSAESRDYQDHLWLGQVYWSTGDRAKAEGALRRALELADTVPETWIAWIEYLSRTDRKPLAEAAIQQARAKLPAELAPQSLALCYLATGQLERAEEQYQETLAARPNDPATLRAVAEFYLRTGQDVKADPYLKRLLDARIRSPEPLLTWARRKRALSLALQGGYQEIREGLALIERNLQARDEVEDRRAKALLQAKVPGGLRNAIQSLEDLERLQPPTPDEKYVLAQLYESAGEWPRARSLMLGLLSTDGANSLYQASFTRSLLRHGEADEAQTWLERLEKSRPDHPQTIELKARLLASRGRGRDAAELLKSYVKDREPYVALFATLLEELGQLDTAETMFRDAVARSTRPDTVLILAEFLGRRRRLSEALDLCDRAWTTCEPEAVAHSSLRVITAARADDERCRRVGTQIEAAIRKHPDSIRLQFDLANLRSLQGNYGDAEALYRRIHQRNKRNDGPLNNLAWLLAVAEGKGHEALTVIDQAIALAGPTPALLDTRAVAHMAMDRTDLAIKDLESAISASPSPEMYLHLAQARLMAKDRSGADVAIRKANASGLQVDNLHPLEHKAYNRLLADLGRR